MVGLGDVGMRTMNDILADIGWLYGFEDYEGWDISGTDSKTAADSWAFSEGKYKYQLPSDSTTQQHLLAYSFPDALAINLEPTTTPAFGAVGTDMLRSTAKEDGANIQRHLLPGNTTFVQHDFSFDLLGKFGGHVSEQFVPTGGAMAEDVVSSGQEANAFAALPQIASGRVQ